MKVGLIGHGHAGKVFHEPLIRASPRLELAAIAGSRDAAALIADPGIGLVVVATPNETHRGLALAALRAGKHVVVDKPLANSSAEAAELIAVAAERGRTLSVFQNRRWDGDFLTVKRLLAEKTLGRVEYFESRFDRFRPAIKPGWREEPKAGSGLFFDLGAHLIDQALNLFGEPNEVEADIEIQRPGAVVDDYFRVTLRYDGLTAVLGASMLAETPGPRFLVRGDAGTYEKRGLDPQEDALKGLARPDEDGTLTTAGGARAVATARGDYGEYYAALAACLLDGGPNPVPAEDARRALVVREAAAAWAAAQGARERGV